MLCASKPSQVLLMVAHAAWRAASIWCEDISSILFLCQTAQTGVSSIVPGYVQIQFTCAHCKIGQWVASSVLPWMTVSCFWSFFCFLNVTTMLSASSKLSDGAKMSCPFLKNLMVCKHKSFVHFISLLGTFKYSQEQHAKKAAPIVVQ